MMRQGRALRAGAAVLLAACVVMATNAASARTL